MKADQSGVVSVPILGQGEFTIDIIKDRYIEYSRLTSVHCPTEEDCLHCNPSLAFSLNPDFCEESVEMSIQVLDEKNSPMESASVNLIFTSSIGTNALGVA